MKLQVLIATMHQKDHSLLEKMNIRSDAIVGNQCDGRHDSEQFEWNGHQVQYLNFSERGVGLNRNNALMRAEGDIILFADDDVVYNDDYVEKILSAFDKYPEADLITFNVTSLNVERPAYMDKKDHRLHLYNCLKYGTFRIAVRRNSIWRNGIYFSLLFGGGATYQCGEDSLFLVECLQKGLKLFASSECIGSVNHMESTWFRGRDEKYFTDIGHLYAAMFACKAIFFYFLVMLKNRHMNTQIPFWQRIRLGHQGIREFRR